MTLLQQLNISLLQYLNSFSNIPIVGEMVHIFADAPIFFLPVFLLGYRFYFNKTSDSSEKEKLMFIFYGCIIALSISLIIQQIIHIERPEGYLLKTGKLLLSHIPDASFPSDHASISFAFVTGIFLFGFRKTAYCYLPFVIIMNIARIIAGVHWPFDIFVGMCVGILSGYIGYAYLEKIKFVKKLNLFIIQILSKIKL